MFKALRMQVEALGPGPYVTVNSLSALQDALESLAASGSE